MLKGISKVNADPEDYSWFNWHGHDEESIVFWEHPSILPKLGVMVIGIMIMLIAVWAAFRTELGVYALVGIPFGLLVIITEYIIWSSMHYIITSKRVMKKTGVFRVDPEERDFSDVDGLDPIQGSSGLANAIVERMFGFGDIKISSDNGDIHFENVASYDEYASTLSKKNSENSFREQMTRLMEHQDGEIPPELQPSETDNKSK